MKTTDITFLTIVQNIIIDLFDNIFYIFKHPLEDSAQCVISWLFVSIIFTIAYFGAVFDFMYTDDFQGPIILLKILSSLVSFLGGALTVFLLIGIIFLIQCYIDHYKKKFLTNKNVKSTHSIIYPSKRKDRDIIRIKGIEYELGDDGSYFRDSYGDEYITIHGRTREIIRV